MGTSPASGVDKKSGNAWSAGAAGGTEDELFQALGELLKAAFSGDAEGVQKAAEKLMACLQKGKGASGSGNAEPASSRCDQKPGAGGSEEAGASEGSQGPGGSHRAQPAGYQNGADATNATDQKFTASLLRMIADVLDPEGVKTSKGDGKGGIHQANHKNGSDANKGTQDSSDASQKLVANVLRMVADQMEESGGADGAKMAALLRAIAQYLDGGEKANGEVAGDHRKHQYQTV
jgi:hypothetical protein